MSVMTQLLGVLLIVLIGMSIYGHCS